MTARLLTTREVAELLRISSETVLRKVRRGELPAIRLPGGAIRFRQEELDAWLVPAGPTGWKPAPRRPYGDYGDVLVVDPCSYCDAPAEHIDHIVALSRGGVDDWTNYTAACGACNRSKGATPMLVWMVER